MRGWIGVLGVFVAGSVLAGSLDSPAGPGDPSSARYTLVDIYECLDSGAEAEPGVFTGPTAGPGKTGRTVGEIMAKAPAIHTNAATAADVAYGKAFWGLSEGEWGSSAGAMPPALVPQTGQTISYVAGDDGQLQTGVVSPSQRFIDNGDETVTDMLTGLMWAKNANLGGTRTWADAVAYCNSLMHAGYSDWRLPSARELFSLIDLGRFGPALSSNHPFSDIHDASYWTSSTYHGDINRAWRVQVWHGSLYGWDPKTSAMRVWPVRGPGSAAPSPPEGMVLISGGTNEGIDPDFGEYSLTVDSFYMDKYLVTKALWDEVYTWAIANGYSFDCAGFGKDANHPVHTINWYDAVKWCNARSEMEGLTPAYYITNLFLSASVYRTGRIDLESEFVKLGSGYRLPSMDEWEYAARGGLQGKRFPWGDTISHENANYEAATDGTYPYEVHHGYSSNSYHSAYSDETMPYTSPVGSFSANGYGLYDMAGNVYEWNFDWHPGWLGSDRLTRGGAWNRDAVTCRVARRNSTGPIYSLSNLGFRTVRSMQH